MIWNFSENCLYPWAISCQNERIIAVLANELFCLKFDIFLSWECYDSRHPNYVSVLKHNCNVMRGEAELGLDMYEGGIGPLGYVFTWKRCWGWNCQVGEREGCRGEDNGC